MKENNDRTKILNQIYRISKMGMEASEIILPLTREKELCAQIARQDEKYIRSMEKAAAVLKVHGKEPKGVSGAVQRMLRNSIKMNTLFRHGPRHISELMIKGTVKGIVSMTRTMNHTPDCDLETRHAAEKYLAEEERSIDALKKYL